MCGAISTRRTFIFMFHQRLLAAPLLRLNLESAPLFFSFAADVSLTSTNMAEELEDKWM